MSNGNTFVIFSAHDHGAVSPLTRASNLKGLPRLWRNPGNVRFTLIFCGIHRGPAHELVGVVTLVDGGDLSVGIAQEALLYGDFVSGEHIAGDHPHVAVLLQVLRRAEWRVSRPQQS